MTSIIIVLCIVFLIAYMLDITAKKSRIPSVILFMLLGAIARIAANTLSINLEELEKLLPVFGTIGLLLIVLEGSLELEFDSGKKKNILQAVIMSLSPVLLSSILLAILLSYASNSPFKFALANAIPLAVISSAIAIPTAVLLNRKNRDFVVYESSLSDIFGVLFFNFITLNDNIGFYSTGSFIVSLLVMLLISGVATFILAFLMGRIRYQVKFMPIIIMVILVYYIAKHYHLPALVFVLILGLVLGNIRLFERWTIMRPIAIKTIEKEIAKFRGLTAEMAFLVRVMFFVTFGFFIDPNTLFNGATLLWSVGICAGIYLLRMLHLWLLKLPVKSLWFIAPRGLITILLFLSIPAGENLQLVNNSLIIQVIVITAIVMMLGMLFVKSKPSEQALDAAKAAQIEE